ncbi:hypothetical protein ALP37_102657 [Pseudomonas amygdali pv. sesami]|nr:hypothetical protein ALP37_102657 [Pseudomonas amygdali pv. sesami]
MRRGASHDRLGGLRFIVPHALRHKSTRHRVSQKRPRSSPSEKTRKSLLSDFIISCTMTYDIGTDPVIL